MYRLIPLLAVFAFQAAAQQAPNQNEPTVFKSDVAMTRVDAQVVDPQGRAITGLRVSDFVLRLDGRVLPIRNFASENMPIDILLLLDVSGSMQPHVQRIASAAHEALNVLAENDRVAIMVFDTSTRVRLPFRSSHSEVTSELNRLLRYERFNGGTRITTSLIDAAGYVQREARQDARRAVVILTDDETQDAENEPRVESALARANAVLSFLQAPYEPPTARNIPPRRGGTWGGGGGTWGGGIPGVGIPGGGGPLGMPGGGPWGRSGGGPGGYDPSHSAGTAEIARDSGGDVMQVDEASALEDTLARLRQRYALYYYLPEGADPAGTVHVDLSQSGRLLYPNAEIHYRRVYMSGGSNARERSGPSSVTRVREPVSAPDEPAVTSAPSSTTRSGRRTAVNEDSGPHVHTIDPDSDSSGTQNKSNTTQPSQSDPQRPPTTNPSPTSGWPRANPQNPPQ